MDEVLERARGLVDRYEQHVRSLLPADAALFDAHVHVGRDIDGMVSPLDELSTFLRRAGVERAFAFCMDEPDREPAFRAANDRTLAAAERSEGLVVPFVRLDLGEQPIEEATRCLDLGARGIKLHPRAQNFSLDSPAARDLFAQAASDGLPVLVHTGFGMGPVSDTVADLAKAMPDLQLILAHSTFIDMPRAAAVLAPYPNVYFETSVVQAYDLFAVLDTIDPARVLYGSDLPYASSGNSLRDLAVIASVAGIDKAHYAGLFGGNLLSLLAGTAMAR